MNLFEQQTKMDALVARNDLPNGGYFRICGQNERVVDLLAEAIAHDAVLATKGLITVIMPELREGWTKVFGVIKS